LRAADGAAGCLILQAAVRAGRARAPVTQDSACSPASSAEGLVPRTRSSHHIAAGTVANFGFKNGTRMIGFLVSFSIPKFAQNSRQMLANFGIGTLVAGHHRSSDLRYAITSPI